jgi:hypothetical protein
MKIAITHYDTTLTAEMDREDLSVDTVVEELFTPLLLALGYPQTDVDKALGVPVVRAVEHG